jgi:hypothetical protein
MATTFTSDKADSTVQARSGLDLTVVYAEYEISAALVINDVIEMVKVPAGAVINNVILATDDLDSGTDLVLDVGDGTTRDRFIDGTTIGQTGGVATLNEVDGLNYKYTAADTIDVLVQAAPGTGETSGTIRLTVFYTLQS